MTDLEDRLRALADAPVPGPTAPTDLHRRARRRTQRRRAVVVGLPLALVAVVAAVVAARPDERGSTVNAGLGPSTTVAPSTTTAGAPAPGDTVLLGDLTGVEVTASPATGLADGDRIAITVTEAQQLPEAEVVFCAGDVTEATALSSCDLTRNGSPLVVEGEPGEPQIGRTTATARRLLSLSRGVDDPNDAVPYDCATEPAGCVLVVAPLTTPIRAAIVPVTFADSPLAEPTVTVDRTEGLRDGDEVVVTAEGFRRNSAYGLTTCTAGTATEGGACDELHQQVPVTTDDDGRFTARVAVRAGFYTWQGRFDCTEADCIVAVIGDAGVTVGRELTFAADVDFPEPTLATDPTGPFTDGQVVTLSGAGFPPGLELGGALGICPADKDPAVEERCGYPTLAGPDGRPTTVGPDGTFAVPFPLSRIAGWGQDCATAPGCVISWVLNHGPAAVSLPIVVGP